MLRFISNSCGYHSRTQNLDSAISLYLQCSLSLAELPLPIVETDVGSHCLGESVVLKSVSQFTHLDLQVTR